MNRVVRHHVVALARELVAHVQLGNHLAEHRSHSHLQVALLHGILRRLLRTARLHKLHSVLLAHRLSIDRHHVRVARLHRRHREHRVLHVVDRVLRQHRHHHVRYHVRVRVTAQTHTHRVLAQLSEGVGQQRQRRRAQLRRHHHAASNTRTREAEGVLLHQLRTRQLHHVLLIHNHIARIHRRHLRHAHRVHSVRHNVLASEAVAQEERTHLVQAHRHLAVTHVERALTVRAAVLAEEQVVAVRNTEAAQHVLLLDRHQRRRTEASGSCERLHVLHRQRVRRLRLHNLRNHVVAATSEAVAQMHLLLL